MEQLIFSRPGAWLQLSIITWLMQTRSLFSRGSQSNERGSVVSAMRVCILKDGQSREKGVSEHSGVKKDLLTVIWIEFEGASGTPQKNRQVQKNFSVTENHLGKR